MHVTLSKYNESFASFSSFSDADKIILQVEAMLSKSSKCKYLKEIILVLRFLTMSLYQGNLKQHKINTKTGRNCGPNPLIFLLLDYQISAGWRTSVGVSSSVQRVAYEARETHIPVPVRSSGDFHTESRYHTQSFCIDLKINK